MMLSSFTSFDICIYDNDISLINYILGVIPIMMFLNFYWLTPSSRWRVMSFLLVMVWARVYSAKGSHTKGFTNILFLIFFSIFVLNIWGAAPFSAPMTSHLMLTLSWGGPIWFTMMIISWYNNMKVASSHYLPENAPSSISLFLAIVETISSYIRPITLSFRLAANMSAGHVILGMIASATSYTIMLFNNMIMTGMICMGYMMFELVICFVQAFVFSLLCSMYTNDYVNLKHIS